MKPLFDYISEAFGSNYDEFKKRIMDAKCDGNGDGIIFQFINTEDSTDFRSEIGQYSSMIIPYNVRNTYSFMKFIGAKSAVPVNSFIKILGGKQVDEYEFTSGGFPQRGPVMNHNNHVYKVKVFKFNVKDALKLSENQLKFIEKPNIWFGVTTSAFFGIAAIDKQYIWDVINKYL